MASPFPAISGDVAALMLVYTAVIDSDPRYAGARLFYKRLEEADGQDLKAKGKPFEPLLF